MLISKPKALRKPALTGLFGPQLTQGLLAVFKQGTVFPEASAPLLLLYLNAWTSLSFHLVLSATGPLLRQSFLDCQTRPSHPPPRPAQLLFYSCTWLILFSFIMMRAHSRKANISLCFSKRLRQTLL